MELNETIKTERKEADLKLYLALLFIAEYCKNTVCEDCILYDKENCCYDNESECYCYNDNNLCRQMFGVNDPIGWRVKLPELKERATKSWEDLW